MKRFLITFMLIMSVMTAAFAQNWDITFHQASKRGVAAHYKCVFSDTVGNKVKLESDQCYIFLLMADEGIAFKTTEYGTVYADIVMEMFDERGKCVRTTNCWGYKDYDSETDMILSDMTVVKWIVDGGYVRFSVPYNDRTVIIKVVGINDAQKNAACAHPVL